MGVRFQRMTHGLRNSIEVLRAPQGEDKALPQLVPKSVQRRLDQKLDRRAQEHLPAEPPNHPNRGGAKLTVTTRRHDNYLNREHLKSVYATGEQIRGTFARSSSITLLRH